MMNQAAIKHRTTKEYVISDTLTSLIIRLTTEQKDIASCSIIYWKRNTDRTDTECRKNLAISYRDSFTDDWRSKIQFEETVQYIKYYFELTDSEGTITYLCQTRLGPAIPESGFFEYLNTNQGEVFSIPSWAQGIVYYQIFPNVLPSAMRKRSFIPIPLGMHNPRGITLWAETSREFKTTSLTSVNLA